MGRITYRAEKETLGDHFVAGTVSALVMLAIVVVGPIVVMIESGSYQPAELYFSAQIWGGVLVALAFGAGLWLGPRRMASLWGHLWGTEQPKNEWLSVSLWIGVFTIIGVGHALS